MIVSAVFFDLFQLKNNDLTTYNSAVIGQSVRNDLNFDTVYGSVGFRSGSHYWELRINQMLDEHAIYIGVSTYVDIREAS